MKWLLDPSEYSLPNPRIDGFRKLKEVNARTVDIAVFSTEAFQYFFSNKKLSPEFIEELKKKAQEIIATALTHAAVVRRAFVVPGLENPPGPYFLGLSSPESVVTAVTKLFEFAITQKYHEKEKSQISGFLYPFIDPEKYNKKSPNLSAIPYGGYGIYNPGRVDIYAVFGNNEGVQSLVADHYEIESRGRGRLLIVKKEIPQKSLMFCTTEDSERDQVSVPVELQFEQVLVDNEILEVGRVLFELFTKYGPQRVEFTAGQSGLIFNEVADYWEEKRDLGNENVNIKGTVQVINSVTDFDRLAQFSKEDLSGGKVIVKVGESIITNRDYDVLGALAAWKDNLYVLYPGVAATQHAMRVLTDKGHKAFLIGTQKFDEGDEAQIVVAGGKVRVTNLTNINNRMYVSLWDASLIGVDLCGGKADRLSKLKILGFQVPHGSVCTTLLFDKILEELVFASPIGLDKFSQVYEQLGKPSPEIVNLVSSLLTDYMASEKSFSTRSSATIEDDSKDSMAGMFETNLNVKGRDLPLKVLSVIRSAFSPQIVEHLKTNPDLAAKLKMAVVLQEMVPARCAGVIFGAKIQTGDPDIVEIETNEGLGEGVVSGAAKDVEQYKFSKSDRRVIERKGPEILSAPEAKALFMLSERLKEEFDSLPQDIEWAIDKDGQIWVLQSRDLYIPGN